MTDQPALWDEPSANLPVYRYPYVWRIRWRDGVKGNPWFGDGVDRSGWRCRVVARGTMNSAWLEFADGYQVTTSRSGLRRAS